MAEPRAESVARKTWLWMVLALVLVAGFMVWLALVSEPTSVTVTETEQEDDLQATSVVIQDFARNPMDFAGRMIRLPGVRVASQLGSEAFWIDLPTEPFATPYLVKLDSALVQQGIAAAAGETYTVTGEVLEMTDSVADAWIASGAITEAQRAEATYGSSYVLGRRVTAGGAPQPPARPEPPPAS